MKNTRIRTENENQVSYTVCVLLKMKNKHYFLRRTDNEIKQSCPCLREVFRASSCHSLRTRTHTHTTTTDKHYRNKHTDTDTHTTRNENTETDRDTDANGGHSTQQKHPSPCTCELFHQCMIVLVWRMRIKQAFPVDSPCAFTVCSYGK